MSFIRNLWYVAAWSSEVTRDKPIGRVIIAEPVVIYRKSDGTVVAFEDRCAHRHAPLSRGRVDGDSLRCMYHGMLYGADGVCKSIPGSERKPPNTTLRKFPIVEKSSWIWIWMGDPAKFDVAEIPDAVGLENPGIVMSPGVLDYEANYQLINDNLCDLSHLDFVHETTLGYFSGSRWSDDHPTIINLDKGLRIERWFVDRVIRTTDDRVDAWNSYQYLLPGIFIMSTTYYPRGTARALDFSEPAGEPIYRRYEQQAVTPISESRSRYFFATGVARDSIKPDALAHLVDIVNASFAEDREMIEAQQRIWDLTLRDEPKAFLPQDKAPSMIRRKISKLLSEEQGVRSCQE